MLSPDLRNWDLVVSVPFHEWLWKRKGMQRTVSKRLQLVEPTVEAARAAAASGTFKDAPTSSDPFVLTLNPVPFSCLFYLNATVYLYPVVLAAFPLR